MEIYTAKGGLKKLLKDYKKNDIAKLFILELNKHKDSTLNSTLTSEHDNELVITSGPDNGESSSKETNVEHKTVAENSESSFNELNTELKVVADGEPSDDQSVSSNDDVVLKTSFTQEPLHKSGVFDNETDIIIKSSLDTFIEEQSFSNRNVEYAVVDSYQAQREPRFNNSTKPDSANQEEFSSFSDLRERLYKLEKKCAANDQYSRRNNIEISGIPDSVPNNLLEGKVIEILNYLNINLKFWDIEACHRLSNNFNSKFPARVIVRFVNRKYTVTALSRKKSLNNINLIPGSQNSINNKIYINENLCQAYREIYDFAYKLLKQNAISHLWSYKGVVHLRINGNNNIKSFTHIDDIKAFFM